MAFRRQSRSEHGRCKKLLGRIVRRVPRCVWGGAVLLFTAAAAVMGVVGIGDVFYTQEQTVTLGFEDIGVLVTQASHNTQVKVMEASRELFGYSIPFTQSKYIYSYDVDIEAGIDFGKVEWRVQEQTIFVTLPEVTVTKCQILPDSFRVYHEQESIFRQFRLAENNEALRQMQEEARRDAVENGLLDAARRNAESLLTIFFAGQYDLSVYSIEFSAG